MVIWSRHTPAFAALGDARLPVIRVEHALDPVPCLPAPTRALAHLSHDKLWRYQVGLPRDDARGVLTLPLARCMFACSSLSSTGVGAGRGCGDVRDSGVCGKKESVPAPVSKGEARERERVKDADARWCADEACVAVWRVWLCVWHLPLPPSLSLWAPACRAAGDDRHSRRKANDKKE